MFAHRSDTEPLDQYRYLRTIRRGMTVFLGTCAVATAGYVIAGWKWVDALYMVTITIFGVGYSEVHPVETPAMKLFTMGVILAGCSSLIYVIGGIMQMLAEGEIERMLGSRNRSREIEQLSDHTIICGYGRVGQMLAAELAAQGVPLVVLDRNSDRVQQAIHDGFLAVHGDAVDDEVLSRVGIFRARTIATVLPDDATNVFITLTARDLSDGIQIIARAEGASTERKLLRSGASHVVMPAAIGALRIAQLATAEEDDSAALPEQRYRMLQTSGTLSRSDDEGGIVQQIKSEIDDLTLVASQTTQDTFDLPCEEMTVR